MKKPLRRVHGAVITCVAVATMAWPSIPMASADGGAQAIGWNQLGLANNVDLLGSNQPFDVSVPVPNSGGPTVLTGTIGSVVNATGRVDVLDARGTVLGSIPIPADVTNAPFVVDVSGAQVSSGVAKLSFVIRDADDGRADECRRLPSVALSQLATTYSGQATSPDTVANFLPRYLDQITIGVGPHPTRDQEQAALTLVADLTHLYRPMPVRIDIDTSPTPRPVDATGTQRRIEVVDGDRAGLVVQDADTPTAMLTISGHGPDLLRQVQLFGDRRYGLVQTPTASVGMTNAVPAGATDTLTFAELGMNAQASVLGSSTLYTGFDAAMFNVGDVDGAKVHLIAKYTPVTHGDATVLVRSGDAILASHVLDQSGVVDLTADVPASSIASNVGMALEVRYVPDRDCASSYDRMTFAVDPQSTITVTPGSGNRGGFTSLPMAFTPTFDVAVDGADQLDHVAQAINLMAHQSTVALQPNVTTLGEAATRGSGLLVAASGAELKGAGMSPPLLPGTDAVDVNGTPVTGVDLSGPLSVLQAFSQNGRTVLAISSIGDPALVDRGFDQIRGLPDRWASLSGDVLATGAAGDPVNLSIRAGGAMAERAVTGDGWRWWTWLTLGIGSAAVLAVGAALVVRRQSSRR